MNKIQNEKWVNALPNEAVSVAEEINIEIAKVIAERIKAIGELSPSDVKKLTNAVEYLGADFGKITKLIAKYSGKGQMAIIDMLKEVADCNDEFANTFYSAKGISAHTWNNDPYLNNLVESITRQTAFSFNNLSNTLAYKIDDKTLTLRQMYTRVVDKAIYEAQSGTIDYYTAMRKSIKQLSNDMRVLEWESGTVRRLDSHIKQNILDGIRQINQQMLDYHGERFGSDGVELSAHAISAPDHAPIQGRQFSNEQFWRMQNQMSFSDVNGNDFPAMPRKIGEWNCKHIRFPIILGISKPVHTEEELKEFERNSKDKYDLTQEQRKMENKLRKLKNERLIASAAGDELEAKRIQRKINEQQAAYREFSEENNLYYDRKRATVEGYRRISTKSIEKSYTDGVGSPNVNLDYIQSQEYKNKFSSITDNPIVNKAIYERSKAALIHQNGKFTEDLSIIDENGNFVGGTSSKIDNETKYTNALNKKIFTYPKNSLIAIHNHGTNFAPTGSDLASAGFHRYKFGIVCCHDGKIYKYSVQNAKVFTRKLFDDTVDKYEKRRYTKEAAIIQTLNDFKRDYGIEWSEIK